MKLLYTLTNFYYLQTGLRIRIQFFLTSRVRTRFFLDGRIRIRVNLTRIRNPTSMSKLGRIRIRVILDGRIRVNSTGICQNFVENRSDLGCFSRIGSEPGFGFFFIVGSGSTPLGSATLSR